MTSLNFNGIPIIQDDGIPDGYIVMLRNRTRPNAIGYCGTDRNGKFFFAPVGWELAAEGEDADAIATNGKTLLQFKRIGVP